MLHVRRVLVFAVASIKTGFSHHFRYVLPCMPFAYVWISSFARDFRPVFLESKSSPTKLSKLRFSDRAKRNSRGITVAFGLFGWFVLSSLSNFPHSLSYFNAFAGGGKHGAEHLINSNIDWGQDLLHLANGKTQFGDGDTDRFYLAFYNSYDPLDLQPNAFLRWPFDSEMADAGRIPNVPDGYYAISVNLLYEFPWFLHGEGDELYHLDPRPMAHLHELEPVMFVGHSIRVFSAQQVRDAYASSTAEASRQSSF